MLRYLKKLIQRLDDLADRRTGELVDAALPPHPVTYHLPGAPPTGRRVLAQTGSTWRRRIWTETESTKYAGQLQWGMWEKEDSDDPHALPWPQLLAFCGPLVLLPEDEPADTRLYGPPGARWGNPDVPCPYQWCVLGFAHAGPHIDHSGHPLGATDAAVGPRITGAVTRDDLETPCTCGRPAQHLAYCARYARMAGSDDYFEEDQDH